MSQTFADFNLPEQLTKALDDLGFTAPTAVQAQAITPAMEGKDLLVSSQTGSGKTVAFLLPTITALINDESDPLNPLNKKFSKIPAPSLLVLCPTRELAQQVMQDAINLVRHVKGMRVASVMGGMPFIKQIAGLKGAQLLIATPGRLLDLVNRRQLDLSQIKSLIVDEADRMLDLGFSEDLEEISRLCKGRGQTLMFSATFADRIIRLATNMTQDPVRISIDTGHSTNMDVTQILHWADGFEHKKKLLTHWLNDETLDQAVVFASTQEDTEMLADVLIEAGHDAIALHGAMPQAVRMRRLKTLRDGRARILVATDVAARGLDIPTISHVINFGLPMKSEDYVHRIGRTGRAGRTGQAITLATHKERSKIRALETYLKARLTVNEITGLEPSPAPAFERGSGRGDGGGRGDGRRSGGGGRFADRDSRGGDRSRRDSRPESRGFGRSDSRTVEARHEHPVRAATNHFKREDGHIEHPRAHAEERPRRSFDRGFDRSESTNDRGDRGFNRGASSDRFADRGANRGFDRSESRPRRDFAQNDDNRGNRSNASDAPRTFRSAGERTAAVTTGERPAYRGDAAQRPFKREGGERPAREGGYQGRGNESRSNDRGNREFARGDRNSSSGGASRDGSAAPRRFNKDGAKGGDAARSDRPIRRDFKHGDKHIAAGNDRKFGAGVTRKFND